MTRFIRTLAIGGFLALFGGSAMAQASDAEEALIRKTLMDYIEGTANGEPERLKRAFHPDFNLYSSTDDDQLRVWEGADYVSRIKAGEKANRIGRIVSVDYEGTTATAKVEIAVPERMVFTDYFLLVKYEQQWKIIHKSYSIRSFEEQDKIALRNSALDTLFAAFDRPNHPALATVAIHKGEVVYQKAFGSTALDRQMPATIETKFQLAGMSKHFTAFGILLLAEQGKLSLTDDIRTYLPWLPVYDQIITVDHLLSTTSGLSDVWELKEIAGWNNEEVFTRQHALELIKEIKPAFAPGTNHLYSNTDQLLLAEIASEVSGRPFSQFMKDEVFLPLGMEGTIIVDDFEQYIPGAAVSYEALEGGGFKRSAINYGINGPTNVYSTIADLTTWELHLLDPKVGSAQLLERLYETCKLENGSTLDSWYGRFSYAQQFYHWGHGVKEVYQIAGLGGFSSNIFKFPDQEFTVVVLSSGIPYSGYLGMGLANHFIGNQFNDPEEIDFQALKTTKLRARELEKFAGFYWSDESCFSRRIELVNDTLRYVRRDGRSSALLPLSKNRFQMMIGGGEEVFLTFDREGDQQMMGFASGDVRISFRQTATPPEEVRLNEFEGMFYCSALKTLFRLEEREGQLVASNPRAGTITLQPAMENTFEGDQEFFTSIHFNADRSKFLLETESVKGVWFDRLDVN